MSSTPGVRKSAGEALINEIVEHPTTYLFCATGAILLLASLAAYLVGVNTLAVAAVVGGGASLSGAAIARILCSISQREEDNVISEDGEVFPSPKPSPNYAHKAFYLIKGNIWGSPRGGGELIDLGPVENHSGIKITSVPEVNYKEYSQFFLIDHHIHGMQLIDGKLKNLGPKEFHPTINASPATIASQTRSN